MSRKDFIAIAAILKGNGASQALCQDMASFLKNQNPAFDRSRFLSACGYPG